MGRSKIFLAVTVAALAFAGAAQATTFYVSPSGSDANPGTSTSSPWKSVSKVSRSTLAPGDSVLFQGGQSFSDSTLIPGSSGAAGQPITFGSYGSGKASIASSDGAVWVPAGGHDLTFDNLDLSSAGGHANVFASAGTGGGVSNITISNSRLHGTVGLGIVSSQPADHGWTIAGNEITDIGDSGLLIFGSNASITGNTIHGVGTSTAISWARHGIYAKGPDMTIAGNDISDVPNGQAISLRFHGARVYGNSIHDTAYAIGFFDYDTAAAPQGTSYVYSNRLWNITGYGFYYDGQAAPNGQQPSVDFVVASNSFVFAGAPEAVNVSPSSSAHVTLANNVFSGQYVSALRAASTTTEGHDLWYGGSTNVPSGTGDVFASPSLAAAPTLSLSGSSPAVDKGSPSVSGLSYTTACDGQPLHYCGGAPDLGAVETTSAAPVSTGLSIAYPTAAAVTGLSFTATVSAPAGTASVKFLLDGRKRCVVTAAPFSCAIRVKAGQHQLTVQAVDAAGRSTSATATFTAS